MRLIGDIGIALGLGVKPWLHLKFMAAVLLLGFAFGMRYVSQRQWRRLGLVAVVFEILVVGLWYFYSLYAFGHLLGPYASIPGTPANYAMVMAGLLIDRHRGIFAQQPLYLVGAVYMVRSAVRKQPWALLGLGLVSPGFFGQGLSSRIFTGATRSGEDLNGVLQWC